MMVERTPSSTLWVPVTEAYRRHTVWGSAYPSQAQSNPDRNCQPAQLRSLMQRAQQAASSWTMPSWQGLAPLNSFPEMAIWEAVAVLLHVAPLA